MKPSTKIYHSNEEAEAIKAFAKKQGLSKSNLFRVSLQQFAKKHGTDLSLKPLTAGNPNWKKEEKK